MRCLRLFRLFHSFRQLSVSVSQVVVFHSPLFGGLRRARLFISSFFADHFITSFYHHLCSSFSFVVLVLVLSAVSRSSHTTPFPPLLLSSSSCSRLVSSHLSSIRSRPVPIHHHLIISKTQASSSPPASLLAIKAKRSLSLFHFRKHTKQCKNTNPWLSV